MKYLRLLFLLSVMAFGAAVEDTNENPKNLRESGGNRDLLRTNYSKSNLFHAIPTAPPPTLPPTPKPTTPPQTLPPTPKPTTPPPTLPPTPKPTTPPPTLPPTPKPTTTPPTLPPTAKPPTPSPTTPPFITPPKVTAGVYYYPWHTNDFHNGEGYLRENLKPSQLPALGEYNDREEAVIRQHLTWSMDNNINLWAMAFWGRNSREDETIAIMLNYMTNQMHSDEFPIGNFQVAMHYESIGLIPPDPYIAGRYDTSGVYGDIHHIATRYFRHKNYQRINGKPVLFVYLTRWLNERPGHPGLLSEVITKMRRAAVDAGYPDIYIVGDHTFDDPQWIPNDYQPFEILDAVTNYDVYGSMGGKVGGTIRYAYKSGVDAYDARQRSWKSKAQNAGCGFIPSATPGFNRQGFDDPQNLTPISRRLTPESPEGSLFQELLRNAINQADPSLPFVMIASFNEWHEDTQIEPVVAGGWSTSDPYTLTEGLQYQAYGTRYLEIIRNETASYRG